MLNYNSFSLLLESKESQINKIKKFCDVPVIYDWAYELNPKFCVWIADSLKKHFYENALKSTIKSFYAKSWNVEPEAIKYDDIKMSLDNFFKNEKGINEYDKKFFRLFSPWIKSVIDMNFDAEYRHILDWLKSPLRTEEVNLSELSFDSAFYKSLEWHKNLKASGIISNEEGTILMTFDDGYYWIDLETDNCKAEGEAMGHCASTSYGDTLYSLRIKQSPHITAAIEQGDKFSGTDNKVIHQMKGRNNKKPIEKYHKYIVGLLTNPKIGITEIRHDEYMSEEDFHLMDLNKENLKIVYKNNPKLFEQTNLEINYALYKMGIYDEKKLAEIYKDLEYINGELRLIFKEWSDFDCFVTESNVRDNWVKEVLSYDLDFYYTDIEFDYTYEYDKISKDTFEKIIDKLIENKIGLYDEENNEIDITKENTKYSEEAQDVIFTVPDGEVLLKDILTESQTSKKDKEYLGDYSFNIQENEDFDLKSILDDVYSHSQEIADGDEAFEFVTKKIENALGKYEYIDGKMTLKINIENIINLMNKDDDENSNSMTRDNLLDIINNNVKIEMISPYNGWQGTISSDLLNDEIVNKLYDY